MAQPHFHPVPPEPPSLLLVIITGASSAGREQIVQEPLRHHESQANLNFILFYFAPDVLCPRAPSSGSPLLGAELSSAARGRGEGKAAEAVPGGTLADISYLKTPKLSLTHSRSLWRGLLTCSLLPELGRAFRIPCNSWLMLDTSLRGPAIPDVLAASSHFWALTGLLWLDFIPESCFLTTKISVP